MGQGFTRTAGKPWKREWLRVSSREKPWRKWLLWSVLLAGVGLLAYMVKRLVSEMQRESEKKVPRDQE